MAQTQNQYQNHYTTYSTYSTYSKYNEGTTIYRKERHPQSVKSLTSIMEEYNAIQVQYTINKNASAPPWYYNKTWNYSYEVIKKVHELHKYHWTHLPYEWQKYYLDYYTYKLQQNEL